jgi:hypothetical protein
MQSYEYKVIPAPRKGEKAKGARSVSERFGVALAHVMNDMAADGWEYLRADTLPCDERVGLTGTATHFHNMLVFRRARHPAVAEVPAAVVAPAPAPRPAPMADMSDLLPEPVEERTVRSPFAGPAPTGVAPPVGPAQTPVPVVPFPNGRG